jgi:replicative DNA helicase
LYNRTEENIHKAELICLKQRDGAIGMIPMHFDPSLTTFSEPKEDDSL